MSFGLFCCLFASITIYVSIVCGDMSNNILHYLFSDQAKLISNVHSKHIHFNVEFEIWSSSISWISNETNVRIIHNSLCSTTIRFLHRNCRHFKWISINLSFFFVCFDENSLKSFILQAKMRFVIAKQ